MFLEKEKKKKKVPLKRKASFSFSCYFCHSFFSLSLSHLLAVQIHDLVDANLYCNGSSPMDSQKQSIPFLKSLQKLNRNSKVSNSLHPHHTYVGMNKEA